MFFCFCFFVFFLGGGGSLKKKNKKNPTTNYTDIASHGNTKVQVSPCIVMSMAPQLVCYIVVCQWFGTRFKCNVTNLAFFFNVLFQAVF